MQYEFGWKVLGGTCLFLVTVSLVTGDWLPAKPAAQQKPQTRTVALVPVTQPVTVGAVTPAPVKATRSVAAPSPSRGERASTYTVKAGDTLSQIAERHGVSTGRLMTENRLRSDVLQIGQVLQIPGGAPSSHLVQEGETLWDIALAYDISLSGLAEANPKVNPAELQIGQVITLPRGAQDRPGAPAKLPDVDLDGLFVWPVMAPVSSVFGPRWGRNHAGIDLAADAGVPIKAAREGTVALSGVVTGYGNTVIIDHPDGTRTLYAHSATLKVKAGQRVKQGEVVATVGSTGNSTGPHLHFEIIVDGKPRDPLQYLPDDGRAIIRGE